MSANSYVTARAATTLTGLAVLSPAAGMAVEMALAWRFGTSPAVDAFRIGAVFLLLGQQLLVLQILPQIVVPVFSDYSAHVGAQEAWQVALSLGNIFLCGTMVFAVAIFLWPGPVVWLFAAGLTGEAHATATVFVRWFALAYVLLVLSGLAVGVLYVHRIFWLPSFAQLVGNAALAGAILLAGGVAGVTALIMGVLLAAALGTALHVMKLVPLMRDAGARVPLRFNTNHPGVRKALVLAVPMLGVFLLGQWAPIVVNRVISGLPSGSLATFGYAFKMGLPVSLAPAALVTVLFPKFAKERWTAEPEAFRALCTRALRMGMFLAAPLAACSFVLRQPLVAVMFERGAFSPEATEKVGRLFGLLVVGAPAAVVAMYLEKMLYALEQAWLPTWVRLGSVAVLTALAPAVAARFGAEGIALLLSLLAWGNAVALFLALCRRFHGFRLQEILSFTAQMAVLAGFCAWLGGVLGHRLGDATEVRLLSAGLSVASGVALGGAFFFAGSAALRLPEAVDCGRYLRWQGSALMRWVQDAVRN